MPNIGNNVGNNVGKNYDNDESLSKNSKITSKELQEETCLSRSGVSYNLTQLKSIGLIKRSGSKKAGDWIVL